MSTSSSLHLHPEISDHDKGDECRSSSMTSCLRTSCCPTAKGCSTKGATSSMPGWTAGAGIALAGVMALTWEPPVHEFEDVSQNLRHGAVQVRRDLLADVD